MGTGAMRLVEENSPQTGQFFLRRGGYGETVRYVKIYDVRHTRRSSIFTIIGTLKNGRTKIRHNCGGSATMFQSVLSVVILARSHSSQAEDHMSGFEVFWANRTKVFHVKHFGTIDGSTAAQRGEHRDRGAAIRLQAGLRLKVGDRLFCLGPDDAIGLAVEIVAAPHEQRLHLAAVRARQARVVGRPCRHKSVPPAQPVGEQRDRQRVGLRRIVGIDRIEIAGDQKRRTSGASGQQQPRASAAWQTLSRRCVSQPRAAQAAIGSLWVRPEGPA